MFARLSASTLGGDHLLPDSPPKHPFDTAELIVGVVTAMPGINKDLANRLERQRAELFSGPSAVEPLDRLHGQPDLVGLARGFAVLLVLLLNVPPVSCKHLADRQAILVIR
ncbi:MAG: hypothetical protein JSU86_18025 [Phycisphaerales bacterium]|nr:MAG: hypothetical protein JSU86_18025 [Phycisphaerales bacterium]